MAAGMMDSGMPETIALNIYGNRIEIICSWFTPQFIVLALVAMFWDSFIFFWYAIVAGDSAVLDARLFPLGHVLVGLGLTYYVFAGFVNKTHITASASYITVQHHPLPFWGNRTIRSSEVRQLQVRERVHRTRPATSTSYEVQVLTSSGRSLTLVKGIDTQAQGLFIEQQIEKYLKIKELPGCAVVHDGAGRGAPGDAGK